MARAGLLIAVSALLGLASCAQYVPEPAQPATVAVPVQPAALKPPPGIKLVADRGAAGTPLYVPIVDGQCLVSESSETSVSRIGQAVPMLDKLRAYAFAPCGPEGQARPEPSAFVYVGQVPVENRADFLNGFGTVVRSPANINALLAASFGEASGATLLHDEYMSVEPELEAGRYTVTLLTSVANRPAFVIVSATARVIADRGIVYLHAEPVAPGLSRRQIVFSRTPAIKPHLTFAAALEAANP